MAMRRLIPLLLALALLLCGCGSGEDTPTELTREEMTITMPAGFVKLNDQEYSGVITFTYGSGDQLITGTKEPLSLVREQDPDLDLQGYAQAVINGNGLDCQPEETEDLLTFTFSQSDEDYTYTYIAAVFESWDGFWLFQAGCSQENFEANYQTYLDCFHSVTISAEEEN